ncbi:MAG: C40 family peptidase, partial [Fibrella sp.]|nr:C40 family peptidase [Armatimonadota bacterium]
MPLSFIERPRRSAMDKVLVVLWWATLASIVAMLALPFRFGLLRAGMVAAAVLLWLVGTYLYRRQRAVLTFSMTVPTLTALFLLSPGKLVDGERLRAAYVESLRSLEGTTYVWGGETRLGIDCSGLVRGAMIDANFREGIRTGNPLLLRTAATLWWFDASAKALGENYRGLTASISDAKSLNDADYSTLRPGDIAVTESGVHTLAYLGD